MDINQPISQIMTNSVHTADITATVEHVEEQLGLHRISSMPVVDSKGEIFGIITLSDLIRFHQSGSNPKAVKAWELCSYRPICVNPTSSIRETAELMVNNKIRHIIVSEDNKTVLGFVSVFDLVEKYVLNGLT